MKRSSFNRIEKVKYPSAIWWICLPIVAIPIAIVVFINNVISEIDNK